MFNAFLMGWSRRGAGDEGERERQSDGKAASRNYSQLFLARRRDAKDAIQTERETKHSAPEAITSC